MVKTERILGVDLTFAFFEISIDQPLYFIDAFECRPGCEELPQDCSFCDYTTIKSCEERNLYESQLQMNCTCEIIEKVCTYQKTEKERVQTWIELKEGRQGPYSVDAIGGQLFRFFFDKPCHGWRIRAEEVYGRAPILMSQVPHVGRPGVRTLVAGYPEIDICPLDFFHYFGTYEVEAQGRPPQVAKFYFVLEFKDFGNISIETKPPQKCEIKDQYDSYCPEIGVPVGPISTKTLNFYYFRWEITECRQFLFWSEILWSQDNYRGSQGFVINTGSVFPLPTEYHVSSASLTFGVCPEEGKDKSYLYILAVNIDVDSVLVLNLFPSDKMVKTPITELNMVEYHSRFTEGLFDVQCGNQEFLCRRGAVDWYISCIEGFNGVSTLPESNPLWPRPRYLYNLDPDTFSSLPFEPEEPVKIDPTKVIGGLILESTIGPTKNIVLQDWENKLPNCTLNFRSFSHIFDSTGQPVVGNHKINHKTMKCEENDFKIISEEIDSLIEKMNVQNDSTQVLATRYIIDSLTFSNTWQACDSRIQSFLELAKETVTYSNTDSCTSSMLEVPGVAERDPCCNKTLRWEQCCVPRNITVEESYFQIKRGLSDKQMCGNSDCLTSLLNEYRFYEKLRNSVSGCSTAVGESLGSKQFKSLEFFRQCKEMIFGVDGKGKECQKDSDCKFRCHSEEKVCIYQDKNQLGKAYVHFFDCVESSMPYTVKEFILKKYDLKEEEMGEFMRTFYKYDDCVTWLGRSRLSMTVENIPIATTGCLTCDSWCFDISCVTPLRCELSIPYGREDNVCSYDKILNLLSESRCLNNQVCNWDNNVLSEEECLQGPNINQTSESVKLCGVCETPSSCKIVNVPISECSGEVCVVNGDILVGVSKEECEMKGVCSLGDQCVGECDSESTCHTLGMCSDRELISYMELSATLPRYEDVNFIAPTDGYCLKHMNPWNEPDCCVSADNGADYPLDKSCLAVLEKDQCIKKKYEWVDLAQNKEECEREKACDEPEIMTDMKTVKNEVECLKCQGTYQSVWKWTQGVWYSGDVRELEVIEPQFVEEHRWETTINFLDLSQDITQSNTEKYSLEIQTEAQCRLNPLKTVMSKILCFCENQEQSEETVDKLCFSQENLEIGVGKICPGFSSSLIAPPSVLYFEEESVEESCLDVSVFGLLESEIQTPPSPTISTSFRKKSKGKDNVKNEYQVYVGELVGDGVMVSFKETTGQPKANYFRLCLTIENSQTSDSYDVYDFGLRISRDEVRPLSLDIYWSETQSACSLINVSSHPRLEFYPIVRSSNWESETKGLSDKEKVVYSIMFVLYLIVLLTKIGNEIDEGKLIFKQPKRWISVCLMMCLFVRLVYFGMLLDNQISDSSDSLSEFLLIEIPTYFYFLSLTLAATLWYRISLVKKSHGLAREVGWRWLPSILLTVTFVLAIILAWELCSEEGSYQCDGRVYKQADTTNQETIRLIYRIVLSVASICVCGTLTYFGENVTSTLRRSQVMGNAQGENLKFRKKIYYVNILSTLSLVSQCIFFILYSSLAEPSYEWVLVLIAVELIPMVAIFYFLRKEKRRRSESQSTSSTSKNEQIATSASSTK